MTRDRRAIAREDHGPAYSAATNLVACSMARFASSSAATSAPPMRWPPTSSYRSRTDSWPAQITTSSLPRTVADRIVPGSTTESDVRTLCGRPDEEHHRRGSGQRRTLVYRGTRRLPSPRRALGPLSTVHHWEEEQHELEIELDGDRVSAVQSRVRRQRASG